MSRQFRAFAWAGVSLVACFATIILQLGRFALESPFDSYIGLVPAIAAGLVWVRWQRGVASNPNRRLAAVLLAAGIMALGFYLVSGQRNSPEATGRLTPGALSFVLLLAGVAAWFLGRSTFRRLAFPLAFLFCMVPLPEPVTAFLQKMLQYASATVAGVFFQMSDVPVFRRGELGFQLPGITLEVVPECSGLQSSLALFVVSLAAGYVFLRAPWKQVVLSLAVIPLGILRNALRIFTIGELCGHFGPQMINSYVHRQGGWIFFLVSLVPFFLLLLFLARTNPSAAR